MAQQNFKFKNYVFDVGGNGENRECKRNRYKSRDIQTNRETYIKIEAYSQTEIHADREKDIHFDRDTNKLQKDRQTYKQQEVEQLSCLP